MAIDMDVYYLYELSRNEASQGSEIILLKVLRPAWRNANETEGEWAESVLDKKREKMLKQCLLRTGNKQAKLVGQFEGWPEGDAFYEDFGENLVEFWFASSGFGHPWIVFSQADSEEDFWRIIGNDEFLNTMRAMPPAQKLTAMFFTENDFDFKNVM